MKNLYLSLEESKENTLLKERISQDNEFKILTKEELKDNKFTILVNGPLTETANLLLTDYKLADNIEEILFVGGTDSYGDVTPVAEKHIYADVNSAQVVFLADVKVVIFGLNITRDLTNKALLPYAYLKDGSIFISDECGAYIETKGKTTYGKMVIDVYSDKQFEEHHCKIILDYDKNKIQQYL